MLSARWGLSPRTRGRLWKERDLVEHGRSIPAVAGCRRARAVTRWRSAVHPRVRGAVASIRRGSLPEPGSSPRTRGRHRYKGCPPHRSRFIPACAGPSSWFPGSSEWCPVHPRVRGPAVAVSGRNPAIHGSFPRAGPLSSVASGPSARRVHPRDRGVASCWCRSALLSLVLCRCCCRSCLSTVASSWLVALQTGASSLASPVAAVGPQLNCFRNVPIPSIVTVCPCSVSHTTRLSSCSALGSGLYRWRCS